MLNYELNSVKIIQLTDKFNLSEETEKRKLCVAKFAVVIQPLLQTEDHLLIPLFRAVSTLENSAVSLCTSIESAEVPFRL